jgi:hypothetical protein
LEEARRLAYHQWDKEDRDKEHLMATPSIVHQEPKPFPTEKIARLTLLYLQDNEITGTLTTTLGLLNEHGSQF